MKEPFLFYKALDPQKGSWDGYGIFPIGEQDFLAYVTDAPSAASIHTPELIKNYFTEIAKMDIDGISNLDLARVDLADGVNQLQYFLQKRGRSDGAVYEATLCVVRKIGSSILYCCVGDSVLQLLRHEKLYRLTTEEIWEGHLTIRSNQNLQERQRTKPLRFIGENGDFVEPSQIHSLKLEPGDVLVLVTDGLEDLLPPDKLIPLLQLDPAHLRQSLEDIAAKARPKDDVTLLSISPDVLPVFDVKHEIEQLQSTIALLQTKQSQIHTEITQATLPGARLDKLERSFQQFSKQVQELNRKLDSSRSIRAYPVTHRIQKPFAVRTTFLAIVAAFVIGAIGASAYFLLNVDGQTTVSRSTPQARPFSPVTKGPSPPEIPDFSACSYTVRKGDTLEKIVSEKQLTLPALLQLNPALNKDAPLKIGQVLTVCNGL